ncbi:MULTISPECIES: zinc-binding dehydrogenase [Rhodococcus]|nr:MULTISPECIES: alcohol dehydrogenase catalytic domain-containing protein [Rhodococcus]MDV7242661.1 alcohol dehydrogenase catalytic domain-containing protein [Rhodococcus oxybenzonivorans]MDV7276094.1 alcohol dehydrogenase catalytic domain-containing protein [Rhodococcus oxybenzonivorans]MDV7332149.1 alcohol dehydrogenase catalytic domain-containing protein [Rhodococcus oxybenzonivorans]MDV7344354.1 alcohol dehydrogenase catalytic domain-containing protein [Rhodococcus oxybenzonivorans]MDV802
MKSILFPGDGTTVLREMPEPTPGPGEVVVKIRASGMCGSDLHFYHGSFDFDHSVIQGHEPCGEIYAIGEGVAPTAATVGDRVMIHHYFGCGMCRRCRAGWPQMCETGQGKTMAVNVHGGHAPFAVVPVSSILPLPSGMSFKAGAAIGCGTGTAWGAIKRLGGVSDTVTVVIGQGPVGLSATMFAASMGATVIGVDIDARRLERAKHFGADVVVNSREESLLDVVSDYTGGRLADVVMETSGRATKDAFSVLGTFGRACFSGLPGEVEFTTQAVYKKQWTVMTSWTMSSIEQARCADYVVSHNLPVDDLYSHRWTIDQAAEAYEWFDKQDAGKGVFEFD